MYVPKKSLPIKETSLAGKDDPVSVTPNSEKLFPGLMVIHSRTRDNHERVRKKYDAVYN
jgi:hypothetical protein